MRAESSRAPYYIKFHIGDYVRDCEELSLTQHGAYLRLMLWYYSTAKPIPNEPERIYRRVHAMSSEERHAVDYCLTEFFVLEGPVWRHKRIDQELSAWNEFSDLQKDRARKRHEIKEPLSTSAVPAQYRIDANQNQNQNQKKERAGTRGTRLSLTDIPDSWSAFCRQERPDLSPETVFAKFRDHWIAAPRGTKLDWEATWRNWVRGERVVPQTSSKTASALMSLEGMKNDQTRFQQGDSEWATEAPRALPAKHSSR